MAIALTACGSRGVVTTPPTETAPASQVEAQPVAPSLPSSPTAADVVPRVELHADRQQASVRTAMVEHAHPERLSLVSPLSAFDAARYDQDPASYLDVIEPGRALAPAQPGPGVAVLRCAGDAHPTVAPLGTVDLTVQLGARMPVSFTSLDRGAFQNGLTAISLQSDDHGLATARFTATAGTVAQVRILAASPLASGQGRWVVTISDPSHP